jgi:hypothetical protein
MSEVDKVKLLNAQLLLYQQRIAELIGQNEVLKAQLRQLGRKPITDCVVSHSR